MSVSSSAQKDYRPLGSGHAHLSGNRTKNPPPPVSGNVKCGSAGSKDGNVNNCESITNISNNCGGGKGAKHILTAAMKEDGTIASATGQKTGPVIGSNGQFETHRHQHTHPHNNSSKISNSSGNDSIISSNSARKSYTGSDPSNASFSSASVAGSVQDDNMSDQCSLTQAGLEEYNSRSYYDQPVFHHQKQSSYAQSEGYHSYVSSSDSSSATPFLDRLRQESELLSRQSHHWSQNDLSSSGNNVSSTGENNSSESTSSTETLKWLGSMSDVSVASHASSAISGSVSSSSQLIVHSSRVRTPKRHNSESVLYMNEDALSVTTETTALNSPVSGSKSQPIYPQHPHFHLTPGGGKISADLQSSSGGGTPVATIGCPQSASPSSPTVSASSAMGTTSSSTSSSASYRSNHRLFPVSTYTEPVNGSNEYQLQPQAQVQAQAQPQGHHHHHQFQQPQSAQPQQQPQHHQASVPSQQLPGLKLSSPQPNNWQSVADRINDFERQQQHISVHHYHALQHAPQPSHPSQKYSYIDPSKTHRVPNPALKAFQKNAVQSYFERQQQNAKENGKNYVTSSGGMGARPQSLQPPNTPKEVPTPQLRTSLPNNYVMPPTNQRSPRPQPMVNNPVLGSPLGGGESPFPDCNAPPPPPPPRSRSLMPIRRSSSASDYADFRENFARAKERQSVIKHQQVETMMGPEKNSFNDCGVPPPPPPPRGRTTMPVRRTSSASEYAAVRDKNIQSRQNLSKDLLGPIIMGPIISVDDWVPERPPKNPHLRIPSPDLPPPPLQAPDSDVNLSNQDEPLPPPPPEILRHTRPPPEIEIMPPSPNRRNSFAGSPSRKTFYRASTFENLSPPSVPKKPSSVEMMHCRPASSLAQSNKAHKVILNGKLECSNGTNGHVGGPIQMQDHLIIPRGNDARMSVRKRAHNSNHPPSPTIEMGKMTSKGNIHNVKSPPPLKPRMPIAGQEMRASSVAINSKIRCNSKASYLPRQSRDKLNIADPDHGSYKLTLTSNEDSVNHNASGTYHEDILSAKCNNLPDVLPKGAKVQASSPSSSGSSPRYGSNNNINVPTPPHTAPAIIASSYPMKSLFHFQSQNSRPNGSQTSNSPPAYSATHRTPQFAPNDPISPKFMSQSTIDLKKTHIIEATETLPSKVLSPAQSESNLSSHEKPPLSPFSARRELQRTDVVRKLSLEERDPGEGRIVRAELVNTTLSMSPTRSEEKIMIRKDSLRENIEKITQLQSKLMTSHLVDGGSDRKMLGYTARTVEVKAQQLTIEKEKESAKVKEGEQDRESARSEHKKPSSPAKPMSTPPLPSSPPPLLIPSKDELISQMDTEIDGLKLMQRTEIILRLNAPTVEAASQTDETLESELSRVKPIDPKDDVSRNSERSASVVLAPRRKLPEEIDCDNLSKELATCLPPTDKLCQVLAPKIYKLSSDYVSGLYSPNVASRPAKKDVATSTPNDKSIGCELTKAPPVAGAEEQSYDSAPTVTEQRFNREAHEPMHMNGTESCDLTKKKEELVNRLTKTLQVLGNEQTSIADDSSANDQLGSDLAIKVAEKVRPIDATKFRAYIDDVGHITMLLLSLSGRLAKAENALHTITENHPDKKILIMKRDRLLEQLEEAKRLKEDIDRRGTIVGRILEKHLSTDEYADYDYFINMKAKLIVDSREIADRIKLNEEQLSALRDTLVQSEC